MKAGGHWWSACTYIVEEVGSSCRKDRDLNSQSNFKLEEQETGKFVKVAIFTFSLTKVL